MNISKHIFLSLVITSFFAGINMQCMMDNQNTKISEQEFRARSLKLQELAVITSRAIECRELKHKYVFPTRMHKELNCDEVLARYHELNNQMKMSENK